MKVRLIKKPDFDYLHFVEVKVWWWPFWAEVFSGPERNAQECYDNLLSRGSLNKIIQEASV